MLQLPDVLSAVRRSICPVERAQGLDTSATITLWAHGLALRCADPSPQVGLRTPGHAALVGVLATWCLHSWAVVLGTLSLRMPHKSSCTPS